MVASFDPVAEVPANQTVAVPRENGESAGGRLARPDTAAAVDVKRLLKNFQEIPMMLHQLVMDGVAAHDLGEAAGLGSLQAEQAHVIGERGAERVVCVKGTFG